MTPFHILRRDGFECDEINFGLERNRAFKVNFCFSFLLLRVNTKIIQEKKKHKKEREKERNNKETMKHIERKPVCVVETE